MEEQLINFETAKLAKEKGFKWVNNNKLFYNSNGCLNLLQFSEEDVPAPTQSLLQKWLREKYDIDVIINTYRNQNQKYYKYFISEKSKDVIKSEEYYNIYEDALEIGLQEVLQTL